MIIEEEITENLGLERVRTSLDLVQIVRNGITRRSFDVFQAKTEMTRDEIAAISAISVRQLQRLKVNDKLSTGTSGRLVSAAKVVAKASDVFDGMAVGMQWLKEPCHALGGETPFSLLDTPEGVDIVSNELLAIEHGIFA